MSDRRQKLINESVRALECVNKRNGFGTISKQTLDMIVARFVAQNASPEVPSVNYNNVSTPPIVDNKDVINLFDKRPDFKSIEQINKENEERIRQERMQNNTNILGHKGRRKL